MDDADYISFPETGRAEPSRQTLLTLANMLGTPCRSAIFCCWRENTQLRSYLISRTCEGNLL
jgi:hypothetical protein